MKGTKISLVFPEEVYNFLDKIAKKMSVTQGINPTTGQPMVNPANGQPLYMSQTGKVEELVHIAIHSSVIPLVIQNPAFIAEAGQIKKITEIYGQYLEKLITGSSENAPKKG